MIGLVELAITLLIVYKVLAITVNYRTIGDEYGCCGHLGVGFPVSLLCNYGTGGSPIRGCGRVDLVMDPKNWTLPEGVELRTKNEVQDVKETQEF